MSARYFRLLLLLSLVLGACNDSGEVEFETLSFNPRFVAVNGFPCRTGGSFEFRFLDDSDDAFELKVESTNDLPKSGPTYSFVGLAKSNDGNVISYEKSFPDGANLRVSLNRPRSGIPEDIMLTSATVQFGVTGVLPGEMASVSVTLKFSDGQTLTRSAAGKVTAPWTSCPAPAAKRAGLTMNGQQTTCWSPGYGFDCGGTITPGEDDWVAACRQQGFEIFNCGCTPVCTGLVR